MDIRKVRVDQGTNREAPGDTPCLKKSTLATKSNQVGRVTRGSKKVTTDDKKNQQKTQKKKSISAFSTSNKAQPQGGPDDQPNQLREKSIPIPSTSKSAQPQGSLDVQPNQLKEKSIPTPSTEKNTQRKHSLGDQLCQLKKKNIPTTSTSKSAQPQASLDDQPNHQNEHSIPTPLAKKSIQLKNLPRFMFRIGSLKKSASRPTLPPPPPPDNRRIAQFIQLGSMIPYAERQRISAKSYPSFDEILERKRRHSSSSSTKKRKEPFPNYKRQKVSNEEEDEAVTAENFPQLNMSMSYIAGRASPSPTDYQLSQEQDQFPFNNGTCQENQPRMFDESDKTQVPTEDFNENVNENEEEEEEPSVIPASHDVFDEDDEEQTEGNKENEIEQTANDYQSDEDIFKSTPEKQQMSGRRRILLTPKLISNKVGMSEESTPEKQQMSGRRRTLLTPISNKVGMSEESRKSIFVACSGLIVQEKDEVATFVNKFGLKCAKDMKTDATHLVVKQNEEEGPALTLKVFQAVARKLWLVGLSWVKDSMSSGTLMDPEPYEVLSRSGQQGPKRARLSIGSTKLFEGFEFFFDGDFSTMKKEDLVYLVTTCGAQSCRSAHSFSLRKKCLIVCENRNSLAMIAQADRTYRLLKIPTVTSDWIRDSLAEYALTPIKGYVIHAVPPKEVEKFAVYEKK